VIRSVASAQSPLRGPVPSPRHVAALSQQTALREVMSQFATGITVLTAGGEHGHGMTANAFSSVSLDPPMVLCCVSRAARMHEAIVSAQAFGVSILAADQREHARYFADWRRPRGLVQFEQVDCVPGPHTGSPLLNGAVAWLECRLTQVYEGGDHSIFLGEVLASSVSDKPDALLFFGGGYHEIGSPVRTTA
jgi:flavin reductase (DIM6/NTAB) family NADH-FMN oxidoreductase RutF